MRGISRRNEVLARVREAVHGSLIVSCQAKEDEPLRDPRIQAAMAQTVVDGGAKAVRANGPDYIRAIRQAVDVPVFGILKRIYRGSPVYITPTVAEARAVVEAGADVLTVDATSQPRPGGQRLLDYAAELQELFDLPMMADVSTLEEGVAAAEMGFDFVATTLAGYAPHSRQVLGPDLELVRQLAAAVPVPVIAEGRYSTPGEARQAIDAGALAVVVGSMITRPGHITGYFIRGMMPR